MRVPVTVLVGLTGLVLVNCYQTSRLNQSMDDHLNTYHHHMVTNTSTTYQYPIECVNGRWMKVNRTGEESGSENVFDVGPWNPEGTIYGNCSSNTIMRRWW